MSSILKALKKLEGEKSQRDELSTAVASDILRTSRQKTSRPVVIVVASALAVLLLAIGYFVAISTSTDSPVPIASEPEATIKPAVMKNNVRTPVATLPPNSDIPRLSGIVYQQDAAGRLAIINDLPAMEGTMVEAYLIKAIQPDRVILLKDGVESVVVLDPN